MSDFYIRINPSTDEMYSLIRAGTFGLFEQYWQFRELAQWPVVVGQGLLLARNEKPILPEMPPAEPTIMERLTAEKEVLDFPVFDYPLAMCPGVQLGQLLPHRQPGRQPWRKRVSIAVMTLTKIILYGTSKPYFPPIAGLIPALQKDTHLLQIRLVLSIQRSSQRVQQLRKRSV